METMLTQKKGIRYSVKDFLENFLPLPISLRIYEYSKNGFVLEKNIRSFNKYHRVTI